MLLSWQVGKLSDRFGSRWPLLFGAAGGACGMLVPYYIPGLPALYVAAVMNGLSFAFFAVSLQNVVGLLSEPHNRALNFSNFSLIVGDYLYRPAVRGIFDPQLRPCSRLSLSRRAVTCAGLDARHLGQLPPQGFADAPPAGSVRDMLTGSGLGKC